MEFKVGLLMMVVVLAFGVLFGNFEPWQLMQGRMSSSVVSNASSLGYGYCRSSAEEINEGTAKFLSTLNKLTALPYFRYYKVNSHKPCPFWAVSLLCTGTENTCDVCKCDENSIPEALQWSGDMSDVHIPDAHIAQEAPHPVNVDDWGLWKPAEAETEYVDLLHNPEGNTGYSGPLAAKVWKSIYMENCFPLEGSSQCNEIGVLRTLLSGLHASINIQVCTNYYQDTEHTSPLIPLGVFNNPNISFFPNCEMFNKRIAPFPQFQENLYVLYQFVLRALSKGKDAFLKDVSVYNTGPGGTATEEDKLLHKYIDELFNSMLLCRRTFDETAFFDSPQARPLVPLMETVMRNVTTLMDCVTCEKCRIWGKLETKGILTAMKIVMNSDDSLVLDRSERVTLINLARQLAFSVHSTQLLVDVCRDLDRGG